MKVFLALVLALPGALFAGEPSREPSGAPFLWEVQAGATRHYLMGSVHLLPESAYPLPAALDAAYANAKGLVLESDLGALSSPETQMQMLSAARSDRADGLKAQIPAALYEQLKRRAATLEMPMELCDSVKPWFCALTLEVFGFQRAGFEAGLGLDEHFYGRASEDEKPVRWLESPDEHVALFTQMPESLSQEFLAATLDEQAQDTDDPEELMRIWRENDLAGIDKASQDMRTHYAKAYERLLAGRNRAWLPHLVQILGESSPQLVIVGAAHFAGPDGLVALLKAKGIAIAPASPVSAPQPARSAAR
jgi:uncharacterized protein YbaP (TraB family)